MKIIKYITLAFLIVTGLLACEDEYKPGIPQGRVEEVAFERDTFIFGEGAGAVEVPVIAAKYVNYATPVTIKVINGTAREDSNFVVLDKNVKIALGEEQTNVELKIINDTLINESRSFKMQLETIGGGGKPAAVRQSCLVIIRNDDYVPEATIVFGKLKDTVREDGGTLIVPFHLTMPAEGKVEVTFARSDRDEQQTAQEGVHFNFKDRINTVVLPEGTLKGEISLDIINNDSPDGDVWFNLLIKKVEGALVSPDSLCRITIREDDLDRTVRFGTPDTPDKQYHEEAGTIEIPLIFEGGVAADRMISGSLLVDSVFGCSKEDFELQTPVFTAAGNETVKIKVKLKDNETFGDWGFRLAFRDLKNVRALEKSGMITIKDDERILGFREVDLEVKEGEPVKIPVTLSGGKALTDINWKVEVMTDGTTADPAQYELPASFTKIYKGTETSEFTVRTKQHVSRENRRLRLRISATGGVGSSSPGKILYTETSECNLTILNTDASIGFDNKSMAFWFEETVKVPVVVAGLTGDALVYVKARAGSFEGAAFTINGRPGSEEAFVVIPDGNTTAYLDVNISKVKNAKPVILEITRVAGDGISEDDINPEARTIELEMVSRLKKLEGLYNFESHMQNNRMAKYENWNLTVEEDADGGIVAAFDKAVYLDAAHAADSKMDFSFEDNTFHLRLGTKVGTNASGQNVAYLSRNTGSSGTYGNTIPMVVNVDFENGWLLWNTNGTYNGDQLMSQDGQLRWGIVFYTGEDALTGSANTNLRNFKLIRK